VRESVWFGDLEIASLLFADDLVLLATSNLQHALGQFAAECEAVMMRVSTSKSEAMALCRKMVECSLRVGIELLSQAKEFKYLGVLFTSEDKMEQEMDRQIGAPSAVMWALYRSVVKIYVQTLTYGNKLWVLTERARSQIEADKISWLRRVAGLSLRGGVRSSDIRRELRVEPLLLRVERSQHLIRAPPLRGFPGTSDWEETPGQTQNPLAWEL